jgi:FKBP-type peptidyl-prolyl cis-trans isomerase FkpA
MRRIIALLLIVLISGTSCYKDKVNNTTCNYDPCATKAPATEITQLETYLSGAGVTNAIKHCSGMYYQIMTSGTDKTPTTCSFVSVNYKGTLTNGKVFDQTTGTPVSFNLISLIEGWKKGIPLIKKGGKIMLYIPPSLGYGSTVVGSIPANSILIFEIELVDVQ